MRRETIKKYVEKYSLGVVDAKNSLDEYEKFFKNMGLAGTIRETVHQKITEQGRARVLDIGCGDGGFLADLKNIFNDKVETIGADLLAPEKKPDKMVVGDALEAEFPGNVDFVFSFRSLHEVGEPEKIIEKAYKCLALGGRAFLSFRTMDLYVGAVGIGEIGTSETKQLQQAVRKGKIKDFRLRGFEVRLTDENGKKFLAGVNIFLEKQ